MDNGWKSTQGQIGWFIAEHFPDSVMVTISDGAHATYEIRYCDALLITLDGQGARFAFPVRGSSHKSWHSFGEGDPQAIADSFLKDLADAGFITLNSRGAINRKRNVTIGKSSKCPNCSTVGAIKEIRYGMPSEYFNHERFIAGGCVIEENAPEISCIHCNWSGAKEMLRFPN